jgi:mono/diheme cytochrome c family protein
MVVAGAALLSARASAQDAGNVQRGSVLAQRTCVACHGVHKGQRSVNPLAPTFAAVAASEGMTAMALNVALLSPHRAMPNILLDPQERLDIIAYILSLKAE